jgi:hypothetical protein
MSGFEFIFTLYGLLLGLALAEGLGGLVRAIKASDKVNIGLPTALLGIFVSCDVVTFWMYGWALRDLIPITWPSMFGGALVTGIYYISASLIFPDDAEDWKDLNGYFDKQRRRVLSGVFICNVALMALAISLLGLPNGTIIRSIIISWSFFPVAGLAIISTNRKIVIGCLIWLIFLYPLAAVWN